MARVYRYGLLPPVIGAAAVDGQISLAHKYQNALIALERERRERYRAIRASLCPAVADLEIEMADASAIIDGLREVIASGKARLHDTLAPSPSEVSAAKLALAELRAARRDSMALLRTERAAARPAIAEAVAELDREMNTRGKTLRATSGVYWGTYLIVEQAMDQARKSRVDPKFRAWRGGDGLVSAQIQGGTTWAEVTAGENTQLQIDLEEKPVREGKPGRPRPRLRLRVGSDERAPIWAEWPLILHRPLPSGCRIKRATVQRRRVGRKFHWSALIQLELPAEWRSEPCGKGAIAVHPGWRKRDDDSIRLAWTCDEAGGEREVVVDPSIRNGLDKADSLRAIRDRNLIALRSALAAWLGEVVSPGVRVAGTSHLPAWFAERTETIAQWRSPARFAGLASAWKGLRWEGDAVGYELLETWRVQDQHLWEWEANQRRKTLGRRREAYRCLAAQLARQYGVLVLADTDLRELARRPPAEVAEPNLPAARAQRHDVAVGEFLSCLRDAFRVRGGRVNLVDAAGITQRCAACGAKEEWDRAGSLRHQCSGCGAIWDQDSNAAHNTLGLWREREDAGSEPGTARGQENARLRPRQVAPLLVRLGARTGARDATNKGAKRRRFPDEP